MQAKIVLIDNHYQYCKLAINNEDYDLANREVLLLHTALQTLFDSDDQQAKLTNALSPKTLSLLQEVAAFLIDKAEVLDKQSTQLKQQVSQLQTANKMQKAYQQ